jgi:15-cis-phytoene synthase
MDDWISPEALLTEGYRRCAKLTWRYGTTYFWGAALLPKPQRKHVYAVYALCRLADDIVDLPNDQDPGRSETAERRKPGASTSSADISRESWASTSSAHISIEPDPTLPEPDPPAPVEGRDAAVSGRLKDFEDQFRTSLVAGGSTDPVMAAVVNTVITCGIDPECFERFFDAMAMDLTRTSYQTW